MSYPFTPKPGPPPGFHAPIENSVERNPVEEIPAEEDWVAEDWAAEDWAAEDPAAGIHDTTGTGHPAVDAVLRSLANAARLPLAEQIAEYEAAHQVLRETLAGIDG